MNNDIYSELEQGIQHLNISETEKKQLFQHIFRLKAEHLNILITGATGCGKSSTINALFGKQVSTVGVGVDPETMNISRYDLQNLTLWDSPGLGDGKENDRRHAKNIIDKLAERDDKGYMLIDLVLVILDGSSRDLGTSFELINQVIIPHLEDKKRIVVAINQADQAMKGKGWDAKNNEPLPELVRFLEEKVRSVHDRILEGTGVDIEPIYYVAGYTDRETGKQEPAYNLSKLLYFLLKHSPVQKRLGYAANINKNAQVWQSDDKLEKYGEKIRNSFLETICDSMASGAEIGGELGKMFGMETVGRVFGKAVGGLVGVLRSLWPF